MTNPKTKRKEREGGINADAVKTTICWGLCAKASTCSVSPVNSFCKWLWFIRFWFISSSNLMCSLSLTLSLPSCQSSLYRRLHCIYFVSFTSPFDLWDIFPFFKLVLTSSEESLEKIKTINKNEYVYCRDGGIWNWNDVMCASFRVVLSHCWPTAVTLSHVCLFPSLPVSSCPLCHYSVRQ